jgi:hypothetical protein
VTPMTAANIIEAAFYATASLGFVELWRLAMPRSIPAIRKSDTLAAEKRARLEAEQALELPAFLPRRRQEDERLNTVTIAHAWANPVEERRRERA